MERLKIKTKLREKGLAQQVPAVPNMGPISMLAPRLEKRAVVAAPVLHEPGGR